MTISLLVAASENNVIGINNELPWNLPNDLKLFKNLTWGLPVIMGRKTFESFKKNLKGRFNIVITRQSDWKAEAAVVTRSIEGAIKKAEDANFKQAFIIGGGEIFRQSMDMADRIYITRVHTTIPGDAFFPEIDNNKWTLISNEDYPKDEKHAYSYSFQVWESGDFKKSDNV